VIVTLILLGRVLEARARGKASEAIRHLRELQPTIARVVRDGAERDLPIEQVRVGDLVVARPGEKIRSLTCLETWSMVATMEGVETLV